MTTNAPTYILASTSPRRQELLQRCQISFTALAPTFPEDTFWAEKGVHSQSRFPIDAVCRFVEELAYKKAESVQKNVPSNEAATIIGADTVIYFRGEILGKPANEAAAREMLHKLSGTTHQVITAVALLQGSTSNVFHTENEVRFYPPNAALIDAYVRTKSPFDKAGAYGIQDMGALFIEEIKGDYYSIMGLPVSALFRHLHKAV